MSRGLGCRASPVELQSKPGLSAAPSLVPVRQRSGAGPALGVRMCEDADDTVENACVGFNLGRGCVN